MSHRRLTITTAAKIEKAAAQPLSLLRVSDIQELTRPENKVEHARFLRAELPLRIAHRLRDIHRTPSIALASAPFRFIQGACIDAFEQLTAYPEIDTEDQAREFASDLPLLNKSLDKWIPYAEKAIGELQPFEDCTQEMQVFWDKLFLTRIGSRAIIEHFLSSFDPRLNEGVIVDCNIEEHVRDVEKIVTERTRQCYGVAPAVKYDVSSRGVQVPMIRAHLRYITQEVLKNAMRATIERHREGELPPVKVCIHQGDFAVMLKVSDHGGGLAKDVESHLWDWGFTTADSDASAKSGEGGQTFRLAGHGVGLPVARLYARYSGGDLRLQHMYGHGTEVQLQLARLRNFETEVPTGRLPQRSRALDNELLLGTTLNGRAQVNGRMNGRMNGHAMSGCGTDDDLLPNLRYMTQAG
jgi:signal transduction histidine kinase